LDENAARRKGNANAQQPGSQGGQPQASGQPGQQQTGNQQGRGQPGGAQNGGPQSGQPGSQQQTEGSFQSGASGDERQLSTEIRERVREAEGLRRDWGATGAPAGRLNEVIEQLKRFADGRMEGSAETAAALKSTVVEPLRQLELELSRHAQQQLGQTNLRLRDEGAAPERYRKAVEEYYRRLSGVKPKQ